MNDALVDDMGAMKALAQHIHGKKGLAKLIETFRENLSKDARLYSKKEIEVQIKRMAKYEKRGADSRVKYYLTPEMQEKYGVKVSFTASASDCKLPARATHPCQCRQDLPSQAVPATPFSPPLPKSQLKIGDCKSSVTKKTPSVNKNVAKIKAQEAGTENDTPDKPAKIK